MACLYSPSQYSRVYLDSGFHLPKSHSLPFILFRLTSLLAGIYIITAYMASEYIYDPFAIQV
jgi:hypothetical protein